MGRVVCKYLIDGYGSKYMYEIMNGRFQLVATVSSSAFVREQSPCGTVVRTISTPRNYCTLLRIELMRK